MEGILPILMVIISILSVISKAQKQKQEAKKAGAFRDAPAMKMPEKEAVVSSVPLAPAAPVRSFFEPAPAVMGMEGEDACHEYMLPDQEKAETGTLAPEENRDNRQAQELVRGVILSEILARPRGMGRRRA